MGIRGVFPETLKRSGGNERIRVAYVSLGFHVVYSVKPLAGRALTGADDRAAAPPVALLSDRGVSLEAAASSGVANAVMLFSASMLKFIFVSLLAR